MQPWQGGRTAALLSLTISYLQESIRGQVGLSTSLIDVVTVAATLLTALAFRGVSSDHSYVAGFAVAGAASLIGSLMVGIGGRLAARAAQEA